MGSTLTSTQPKDTYKSLLKTSDTTELSATAKYVSDGNGNDSPLALSTANVGIGTSTPTTKLEVVIDDAVTNDSTTALNITHTSSGTTANGFGVGLGFRIENSTYSVINEVGRIEVVETDTIAIDDAMVFYTKTNNSLTEKVRIIPSGGITFNGDTAAANALDDYEEGTWTPVLRQDGTPNTATYTTQSGTYTKIGNIVTVFYDINTSSITAGSGFLNIGDLPFTVSGTMAGYSYGAIRDASALNTFLPNGVAGVWAERNDSYLRLFYTDTTTGQEAQPTAYAASGRITGTIQYTV
jgi:hypothetical protein